MGKTLFQMEKNRERLVMDKNLKSESELEISRVNGLSTELLGYVIMLRQAAHRYIALGCHWYRRVGDGNYSGSHLHPQ